MAPLDPAQIQGFVEQGFVRLEEAFSREVAAACRAILWRDTGCDPDDRTTWTRPVVRLGEYGQAPFVEAAGAPRVRAAIDQLVGPERWLPRTSLGTFPVRFPSDVEPDDAGWHVDASFPGPDPADYMSYRVNVASRGRALLALFLFSDVGEHDAPTRVRVGSHLDVVRFLAPAGEAGLSFMELAARLEPTASRPTALATGPAGTVYLCHPFLVHAAQRHLGTQPRFLAQPPILLARSILLDGAGDDVWPIERAIREALA